MAPSRFLAASPFKNVQANIGKKENWFSELPLSTSSPLEASNGIQASTEYSVERGSSVGSLLFLDHGKPGKYGQKAATWNASGRPVTDFALSPVEPLVACASEGGRIAVASMPALSDVSGSAGTSLTPEISATLTAPAQRAVEVVQFHPTSSGLLLSNQGSDTQIWDAHAGRAALAFKGPEKGHWSAGWSSDGRFVHTAGKDNTVNVWDVRNSTEKASSFAPGHQGFNKPTRIASISEDLILTTGFTKTRDRECSLWDARNFAKPISNIRLDTNTGVLMPLVDQTRKMVYLVGRADMSLRWIEVTGTSTLTQGAAALPTASVGAAILPSTSGTLDVMQAEVAKLVILGQEVVIPVTIQVPRRNYLDFHSELYPPHPLYQSPAQDAGSWLEGADEQVETAAPAPKSDWGVGAGARSPKRIQKTPTPAPLPGTVPPAAAQSDAKTVRPEPAEKPLAPVQSPRPAVTSEDQSSPTPVEAIDDQLEKVKLSQKEVEQAGRLADVTASTSIPTPAAPLHGKQVTSARSLESARPTDASPSSRPIQSQQPAAPATSKAASPATRWSRSFLAGKTALKPDYEDVHGVATTLGASVQLLKANSVYLFYPLAGPGGRLAVHPIAAKGRLPVHAPSLACGSDIVDFVLDPFDETRVYLACQDAKIRVFRVPEQLEGDYGETETVLDDGADKLLELQAHPAVKDLLLCVSDDRGDATLRVWDTRLGRVVSKTTMPGKGIHSVAWDALGARVAVSCKDKTIRIIDPRNASAEPTTGPSHDSVRPSKVVWVDDRHLITSGFSRSAFREILLHRVMDDGTGLQIIGKAQIDVSPALLFPHYDSDTNILFAFSKGERTCHAYDVDSADKNKPFTKLPSFEHGQLQSAFAFLPKQTVDVRKVEVARAYRLTPASIQHVSFSIPRAKMDFFQDDIFPPTLDKLAASSDVGPQEWESGRDVEARYVNLRPEGMALLSEAPAPAPRTKQQVMRKQMTEEESQQQYLDSLFKNKQAEVDSDSDAERRRRRDEVDDDDDW